MLQTTSLVINNVHARKDGGRVAPGRPARQLKRRRAEEWWSGGITTDDDHQKPSMKKVVSRGAGSVVLATTAIAPLLALEQQ